LVLKAFFALFVFGFVEQELHHFVGAGARDLT
jgi:hypothetical protein